VILSNLFIANTTVLTLSFLNPIDDFTATTVKMLIVSKYTMHYMNRGASIRWNAGPAEPFLELWCMIVVRIFIFYILSSHVGSSADISRAQNKRVW
jgi:hypothetical protein